jgi:hypothetical protein
VAKLFEDLGGRFLQWCMTTSEYDRMVVVEAPGQDVVMSAAAASLAGGGTSSIKTFDEFSATDASVIYKQVGWVAAPSYFPVCREPWDGGADSGRELRPTAPAPAVGADWHPVTPR